MPEKTRRRFLEAAGAGVAVALAGCGGSGDEGTTTTTTSGDGGGSGSGDGGDTTTTTTTTTEETTDETSEETTESGGGELRIANTGKIKSLDPIIKGTGGVNQWAETLLGYEDGTLPPKPELAESVEISEDGTTYRFKLKEGVTFHDGTELTATDFVYSWERLAQSPNTQNNDDIIGGTFTVVHEKDKSRSGKEDEAELSDYVPGSLAVRAPEKYVFEFDVEEPFHAGLAQIASESSFVAIPENTVGDIEREGIETSGKYDYQEAFGTKNGGPKVAGTGPFQVDVWSKGDQLVLTRYDDYHGQVANIDAVRTTILSGGEAAYRRALNGNLDLFSVPLSKFDPTKRSSLESIGDGRRVGTYTLSNGTEVNYAEVNALETDYILFNCDRVPKAARQAIALLLNQQQIAESVYKGEQPAYALTPPQVYPDSYMDTDTPAEAYRAHFQNGTGARTRWGENGYPWGIGESRIQEARKRVSDAGLDGNTYTLTIFQGDALWDSIASRIQQKARAAGLQIEIKTASYSTIISEGGIGHNMDFFSLGDSMEWPESDNFLRFLPPVNANGKYGFTQWGRKEGGEWATAQMRTAQNAWENNYLPHRGPGERNQVERDRFYLTIEEINWNVVQELPLTYRVNRSYWSQDLDYTPTGVMGDKVYNGVSINRQ